MTSFAFTSPPLADGAVAAAANIQNQLNEIKAHLANAGLIDNAALANPEHLVIIGPIRPPGREGVIAGASSPPVWQFAYKPTVALIPYQVDLYLAEDEAGTGSEVELDVKEDGSSILGAVLVADTPDTIVSTRTFSGGGASIAADATITFHVRNRAASGNDARHVSFSLTCKAEHTT